MYYRKKAGVPLFTFVIGLFFFFLFFLSCININRLIEKLCWVSSIIRMRYISNVTTIMYVLKSKWNISLAVVQCDISLRVILYHMSLKISAQR